MNTTNQLHLQQTAIHPQNDECYNYPEQESFEDLGMGL